MFPDPNKRVTFKLQMSDQKNSIDNPGFTHDEDIHKPSESSFVANHDTVSSEDIESELSDVTIENCDTLRSPETDRKISCESTDSGISSASEAEIKPKTYTPTDDLTDIDVVDRAVEDTATLNTSEFSNISECPLEKAETIELKNHVKASDISTDSDCTSDAHRQEFPEVQTKDVAITIELEKRRSKRCSKCRSRKVRENVTEYSHIERTFNSVERPMTKTWLNLSSPIYNEISHLTRYVSMVSQLTIGMTT